MWGRYMMTSPFESMVHLFRTVPGWVGPVTPRRNISPTQNVPVVLLQDQDRHVLAMRWGIFPHWYKAPNDGTLLINIWPETIASKPAVRERRCLFPVDGFYEWSGEKGSTVAHLMRRRDGEMIALAGIWQLWGEGEAAVATCAIVTCAANETMAPIHHRMPVVIEPDAFGLWLGEEGHGAATLMKPAEEEVLTTEVYTGGFK